MKTTNEVLLSRQEVAEKFKVSIRTLKKWRDTGILPAYKFGGVVRYKASEIDSILNSKQHG